MIAQINANMIKSNENFIKKLDARYLRKLPEKFLSELQILKKLFTFEKLPTLIEFQTEFFTLLPAEPVTKPAF